MGGMRILCKDKTMLVSSLIFSELEFFLQYMFKPESFDQGAVEVSYYKESRQNGSIFNVYGEVQVMVIRL